MHRMPALERPEREKKVIIVPLSFDALLATLLLHNLYFPSLSLTPPPSLPLGRRSIAS